LEPKLNANELYCVDFIGNLDRSWKECIEELVHIRSVCSDFVHVVSADVRTNDKDAKSVQLAFDSQPLKNSPEQEIMKALNEEPLQPVLSPLDLSRSTKRLGT
jgi:hypothetical protein